MHRDKYAYEFIVIMSSLIPGTTGREEHRGRRDRPCRTARQVGPGVGHREGVAGEDEHRWGEERVAAVEVGLFYWEFWRVVARICESRLFDSFQR